MEVHHYNTISLGFFPSFIFYQSPLSILYRGTITEASIVNSAILKSNQFKVSSLSGVVFDIKSDNTSGMPFPVISIAHVS